jgi:hypothetical protein
MRIREKSSESACGTGGGREEGISICDRRVYLSPGTCRIGKWNASDHWLHARLKLKLCEEMSPESPDIVDVVECAPSSLHTPPKAAYPNLHNQSVRPIKFRIPRKATAATTFVDCRHILTKGERKMDPEGSRLKSKYHTQFSAIPSIKVNKNRSSRPLYWVRAVSCCLNAASCALNPSQAQMFSFWRLLAWARFVRFLPKRFTW